MNYETRFDSDNAQFGAAAQGEAAPRRSWLKIALISLALLLALVAIWFVTHGKSSAELSDVDKAGQAPVVSVISPGRATVLGAINATGTLAARREIPVGSVGEGGQVVSVLVEPGQWVRQGQVLAVIDRSVQAEQQAGQAAQIRVAEADARLAQANLQRSLRLVERGFVSRADVDRLTATRDSANARVQVARAQLGTLRAQSARLNILAPASGLVLERKIEPGQVVGGGSGVLFRIAKGGEMELKAQLGQADLARISTGVAAEVTPVGSTQVHSGQVWQVSPVIDPASRQGVARIALAYSADLPPGGFASAVIRSGTVVAPMLPESAILSDDHTSYVYIVDQANKVARRNVQLGMVTDNGIVIAAGLDGSERVVLRAGGFLSPGEAVKPVVDKPAAAKP
jgi:HlyD family secretion protein